jgi:hypothetical protein
MNFVQLFHKLFNECLVKLDVAHVLGLAFFGPRISQNLGLQKEVRLTTNLVLKVLAHQVGQESAHFQHHVLFHRSNGLVFNELVLLDGDFAFLGVHLPLSQLLVKKFAQLVK